MNKFAILLLATVVSTGATAGEVGAKSPKLSKSATLAYTAAETGTNESKWGIGPINTPATYAQHNRMIKVTNKLNDEINSKLANALKASLETQ